MATPETMTKWRLLTHPFSTVAYAMRVLLSFDSQYLEQPHCRDKGHSKKCENHSFLVFCEVLRANTSLGARTRPPKINVIVV